MSSETIIRVERLHKSYEIYDSPRARFKQLIVPPLRRLLGLTPRSYFQPFHALQDVSFEVARGETFGVIGRNGSGKSTLLQILCGTLTPSSGRVEVQGKIAALLELGAGFNPEFSGRENVYLNGRLFGLDHRQMDARLDRILAFADIGDFIDRPVKTYSSGMYVRLAFAVIAHVDADVLIVDEALSVGDAYFVQKCMRFLRGFIANGGALLFVSHDTGAVLNLCTQALWLERGRVRGAGMPKDIVQRYLEQLVAENQSVDAARGFSSSEQDQAPPHDLTPEAALQQDAAPLAPWPVDMRERFINTSNLRNDIVIQPFDLEAPGFGLGQARILRARLLESERGAPLSHVVGGEMVCLEVEAEALEDLDAVIFGFDLKNRLGQSVFGDNSYLSYRQAPVNLSKGQTAAARFEFRCPLMPVGDYAITVAVATGTQDSHVMQHWIHDAILLQSMASRVCTGMIGIPMQSIEIRVAAVPQHGKREYAV